MPKKGETLGCGGDVRMGFSGSRLPPQVESLFPNLAASGYEITSDPSYDYNCIAWAMHVSVQRWDWTDPDGYWPPSVPRDLSSSTLVQVFADAGYTVCDSDGSEVGYDKIAIYVLNGRWQHAARQLRNGRWTNKLGDHCDITHPTLESLAVGYYGIIFCIMRREIDEAL